MTPDRKLEIFRKLTATREDLLVLCADLSEEQWHAHAFDESSEWQVVDILRHLADSERGMTALMARIRDGGEGVPADFDLHRWNQRAVVKLQEKPAADLLASLAQSRVELLALINTLQDEDWDKTGRHASLRIMSIEQICNLIADHEHSHCDGIRLALAKTSP